MLYKTINRPQGFDLAKITPADISIQDIALALSNTCRYGGHVRMHYSVAEHSCRLTQFVSDEFKFEALMHDAAEAYVCDIPAPLKQYLPRYQKIEARVHAVVANTFGLPTSVSEPVQRADIMIRELEMHEMMQLAKPSWYDTTRIPPRIHAPFTYFLGLFSEYRKLNNAKC